MWIPMYSCETWWKVGAPRSSYESNDHGPSNPHSDQGEEVPKQPPDSSSMGEASFEPLP